MEYFVFWHNVNLTNLHLKSFCEKLVYSNKSIASKHIAKQAVEAVCVYILKHNSGLYEAVIFII